MPSANLSHSTDEIQLHRGIHITDSSVGLACHRKKRDVTPIATGQPIIQVEDKAKEPVCISPGEYLGSLSGRKSDLGPTKMGENQPRSVPLNYYKPNYSNQPHFENPWVSWSSTAARRSSGHSGDGESLQSSPQRLLGKATTTPAALGASPVGAAIQPAPGQPAHQLKLPDHIVQHVNQMTFLPEVSVADEKPDVILRWQTDMKDKYSRALLQMDYTRAQIAKIDAQLEGRTEKGNTLSAEEQRTPQSMRATFQWYHATAQKWVKAFRRRQAALKAEQSRRQQSRLTAQKPIPSTQMGRARGEPAAPNGAPQNSRNMAAAIANAAFKAAKDQQIVARQISITNGFPGQQQTTRAGITGDIEHPANQAFMDSMDIPPQVHQVMRGQLSPEVKTWIQLKACLMRNPGRVPQQLLVHLRETQLAQFRRIFEQMNEASQQAAPPATTQPGTPPQTVQQTNTATNVNTALQSALVTQLDIEMLRRNPECANMEQAVLVRFALKLKQEQRLRRQQEALALHHHHHQQQQQQQMHVGRLAAEHPQEQVKESSRLLEMPFSEPAPSFLPALSSYDDDAPVSEIQFHMYDDFSWETMPSPSQPQSTDPRGLGRMGNSSCEQSRVCKYQPRPSD